MKAFASLKFTQFAQDNLSIINLKVSRMLEILYIMCRKFSMRLYNDTKMRKKYM